MDGPTAARKADTNIEFLCPNCGRETHARVVDSRCHRVGLVRRRRECDDCRARFTTYESVESVRAAPRSRLLEFSRQVKQLADQFVLGDADDDASAENERGACPGPARESAAE